MRLSESGVKKPVTTLMVFLAVLVLGYVSYTFLPVDMMPEIENPAISVFTLWDGANTEDVETKVTRVIESALGSVTDLDEITSSTSEGRSRVTCRFKWGTDLGEASNDMRDLLERAKRRLPDDADDPLMFKFNTANMPVLFFGVTARENREGMNETINDDLVDVLKRVPGVGSVEAFGGLERQVNVHLDPDRLSAYGLSLAAVAAAIDNDNKTEPAGNIKIGPMDYTIRVPGEFGKPGEVGDVVVKRSGDALVRLSDIAVIEDGFVEIDSIVETNGKWSMMMMVQKRSGANTVDVCRRVLKRIGELKANLPADYEIFTIGDSSETITKSIRSVGSTILYGGLFVVLTTLFFLRSLRTSLIIALTIPASLIIAFIFMYAMGWTINIMSLSALAVAIGMVVDNAVVVLENILSHMSRGTKRREAAMFGTDEVGLAVVASTLTTIVVFLPLVFMKGVSGIMMKQLGGLITITLSASLFCSLYLTPMLASVILAAPDAKPKTNFVARFKTWSERGFVNFETGYGRLLALALRWRWWVVALAAAVVGGTVLLFSTIGSELMGSEDTGELRIVFELPVGTRHEQTALVGRRMLALARQTIGAENIVAISLNAGPGGGMGGSRSSHAGTLRIKLVSSDLRPQTTDQYGNAITSVVREWPEIAKVFSSSDNFMNRILRGGGANLAIDVYGYNLQTTAAVAGRMAAIARETPGSRDVRISQDNGRPELSLQIDRFRATALGLTMDGITQSLSTLFQGSEATQYREADDQYAVLLRLADPQRQSIEDIRRSEITTPTGARIRIDSIAMIEERMGPATIDRKNQERVVTVEFDAIDRPQGDVLNDIRARIAREILLPDGVTIEYSGMIEEQVESERAMKMMIVLGILLVYMVMAGQFESFRHPFIIMFSLPFAFSGVAIALTVTKTPLSMIAYIGCILLIGVVVNNAIVLIDYINILRARGETLRESIVNSGRQRLRPVLITSLTTMLGMLPLALSHGDGSATWRPLGIVVVGGLSVSTIVTLVIVPVLYDLMETRRERRRLAGRVA
jgi:HAE1 family hydrophobic/amphiphilic exporter-1